MQHGTSLGDDAVEFAERATIPLEDWQQHLLRAAMSVDADGRWQMPVVGLASTSVVDARLLVGAAILSERVALVAPTYTIAHADFDRVVQFVKNWPVLDELVTQIRYSNGEQRIDMRSGGRVEFHSLRGTGCRGTTVDVLMLREKRLAYERRAEWAPRLAPSLNPQLWWFADGEEAE